MPPKKKPADKKATDEPEYAGPNIYKELLDKTVPELVMDLNAPDSVLLNENVEFEILIDRLNSVCTHVDTDNKRLERLNGKIENQMEVQDTVKTTGVNRSIRERNEVRANQEEQRVELTVATKNQKTMQELFGKWFFRNSIMTLLYSWIKKGAYRSEREETGNSR